MSSKRNETRILSYYFNFRQIPLNLVISFTIPCMIVNRFLKEYFFFYQFPLIPSFLSFSLSLWLRVRKYPRIYVKFFYSSIPLKISLISTSITQIRNFLILWVADTYSQESLYIFLDSINTFMSGFMHYLVAVTFYTYFCKNFDITSP